MIVKSDSSDVQRVALSLQSIGKLIESELERELMRAGADTVVVVINRIKRQGEDAQGNTLETKSTKRTGRYSKRYGKTREDAGKQTAKVDLTMAGQLTGDYNLTEIEPRRVGVGFITETSHEIADYLEEYYGGEIFIPSVQEEDEIFEDAMRRIEILIEKA